MAVFSPPLVFILLAGLHAKKAYEHLVMIINLSMDFLLLHELCFQICRGGGEGYPHSQNRKPEDLVITNKGSFSATYS